MIGGIKKGSSTGTKKRVCETLFKKNVEVPTEMKFEVGVVIITFQMACELDYSKKKITIVWFLFSNRSANY